MATVTESTSPPPGPVPPTVGARLREERRIQKVSRPQLAKTTGIPYSTIADIENGYQDSSTRLHELARAFPRPLRVEWLADGEGDKYVTEDGEKKLAYHGVYLTRAGALLAAEWEKLDVEDRLYFETQIHARVAKKKRVERASKNNQRDLDSGV